MFEKSVSRRAVLGWTGAAAGAGLLGFPGKAGAQQTLRYGHMNSPTSNAGLQAQWFAEEVARTTGGEIAINVYPSSQLGKIRELAAGVSTGTIALSHNTAGAISALSESFAALDTPYLYRDVDHLMKVVDIDSPVMQMLNERLVADSGVRVLYAFYFGTRQLTADREIKRPSDLEGVKIRAIPSPIYLATVEGLGAVPVPVDWSEVPTALATGVVSGQENPVNVVLDNKLFDVQSHMMLTGHIQGAELVLINDSTWQSFSSDVQSAVQEAASVVRERASQSVLDGEASNLQALKDEGMTIIGPDEGLDLEAFQASVKARIDAEFAEQYGDLYQQIEAIG
ncbi:TRAP transporter substrate-binding protein [Inquilinus sp. CAU 1745]|uniref:TRAP transporter substrate-binding protein n=1 Tax=Inquilinus sp. CAU 1745 TaxID=3140369 RepID=UPI00325B44E2